MAYDANGLVTIEPSKGSAAGREKAAAFLNPTPTEWSIASLVEGIFGQLVIAAMIVVDSVNRKVYFTDDETAAAALKSAATSAGLTKATKFTPVPGQTGKTLEWSNEAMNSPDNEEWIIAPLAPAVPKKSASSLVSMILNAVNDGGDSVTPPLVVIDQAAKEVWAVEDDELPDDVSGVVLTAGNAGVLTLSEPADGGTVAQLPFEGGAV
jgi:hypothetical protein